MSTYGCVQAAHYIPLTNVWRGLHLRSRLDNVALNVNIKGRSADMEGWSPQMVCAGL